MLGRSPGPSSPKRFIVFLLELIDHHINIAPSAQGKDTQLHARLRRTPRCCYQDNMMRQHLAVLRVHGCNQLKDASRTVVDDDQALVAFPGLAEQIVQRRGNASEELTMATALEQGAGALAPCSSSLHAHANHARRCSERSRPLF